MAHQFPNVQANLVPTLLKAIAATNAKTSLAGWHMLNGADISLNSTSATLKNGLYVAANAGALVAEATYNGHRTLLIDFQETNDAKDAIEDFRNINAHYKWFAPLVTGLNAEIAAGTYDLVLVAGWSLGGSMAQMFAANYRGIAPLYGITIGAPGYLQARATADSRLINYKDGNDLFAAYGGSRAAAPTASASDISRLSTVLGVALGIPATSYSSSIPYMTANYYARGTTVILNGPAQSGTALSRKVLSGDNAPLYAHLNTHYAAAMTKVAQNPFDLGIGARATAGNDYLFGTSGSNRLSGLNGNDVFFGRAGSDTLNGGAGTDTANYVEKSLALSVTLNGSSATVITVGGVNEDTLLNIENLVGGLGADIFVGDANDNLFTGGPGRDTLDGGAGSDTASYAEKTGAVIVTLSGATNALVTVGGRIEDTLRNIENVLGGKGNDVLTGDELANSLRGGSGADTLSGGLAVDTLAGGLGRDLLTGGEGGDVFVFDHKPGSLDWDTLADFEGAGVPDGDVLQLSHAIFSTLAVGALSATAFQSGLVNVANNAGTRIVYNQSSGELFYDADGSGSGAALKLAVLANHPSALSADDFLIV